VKLNNRSFPYPILVSGLYWRDDYQDSDYQVSLSETVDAENNIIEYDFQHMCSSPDILDLIDQKKACYGVLVECSQTRVNYMYKSFEASHIVSMPLNSLYGRFELTPQIVVLEDVKDFSPEDLHEEFADTVFDLKPGDVLGHDEVVTRSCDFHKLSFSSLVKINTSETLEGYEYEVNVDDYSITLLMGKDLRAFFNQIRAEKENIPYLAMSIFKDVYLQVLSELSVDEESKNKIWGRAMLKALDQHDMAIGPDTELKELNRYAQKLVSSDGILKLLRKVGI
jgi:hypothetical protein